MRPWGLVRSSGLLELLGVLLSLAFSPPAAPPADAATVSGIVRRPPAPSPNSPGPNRYRGREAAQETATVTGVPCACNPGEFSVIWLTGDNLPPVVLPAKPPSMSQKDRMFTPAVLAIPVGSTVEFPNYDPYFHNVFSYSKIRTFDLGRYPKGQSESVRFEKPGIVPVFCEIHYSMRAYIHVMSTPYFAVTDISGKFTIPDVNASSYTIHVWQENLPEILQPLTVGDDAVAIELP
jgi:plastocyanin